MNSSTPACENGLGFETKLKVKTKSPTCMLLGPTSSDVPLISAILVTQDGWRDLDKLLEHLGKQTIQCKLELVIVADSLEKLDVPESKLRGFHSVRALELSPLKSVSNGHFSGAMLARAPLVVFCEDHCFPEPGWADALVRAHAGPWAAVAPLLNNNNPARAVSRAVMGVEYGIFCDPSQAGEREFLPGHNSCYKKQALLEFSQRLEFLQDTEYLLHLEMRRAGWKLFQCAEARTAHTNIALFWPALISCFHSGRCFAASRAADWPFTKKVFFALGSPLLPFLRHRRHVNCLKRSKDRGKTPAFLPLHFLLFAVDAWGQMLGNLAGHGSSYSRLCDLEFKRYRFIPAEEAALFKVANAC
jgi:hypothetical protein